MIFIAWCFRRRRRSNNFLHRFLKQPSDFLSLCPFVIDVAWLREGFRRIVFIGLFTPSAADGCENVCIVSFGLSSPTGSTISSIKSGESGGDSANHLRNSELELGLGLRVNSRISFNLKILNKYKIDVGETSIKEFVFRFLKAFYFEVEN